MILGVKRERIEILQGRFKDEKCGEVNENKLQMYVNMDKKGDCQCFFVGVRRVEITNSWRDQVHFEREIKRHVHHQTWKYT